MRALAAGRLMVLAFWLGGMEPESALAETPIKRSRSTMKGHATAAGVAFTLPPNARHFSSLTHRSLMLTPDP